MYIYMCIHIYIYIYIFSSGPDPRTPKNRPEMAGNGGPGRPPTDNPPVEPLNKNTKYRQKVRHK